MGKGEAGVEEEGGKTEVEGGKKRDREWGIRGGEAGEDRRRETYKQTGRDKI